MKNICSILFLLFAVSALVGCAGNKPAVEPVARDSAVVEAPRDSLRAKFQLTIDQDSAVQELDAVLFSVPGKRYRMELTGPLGIGVASMLWQEKGWQMTFPTEKLYMDGVGYMVGLMNSDILPLVHIHQVADIFDGRLLPEGFEEIAPPEDSTKIDGAVYAREKTGRPFSFMKEDGHVSWLSRTGVGGKTEVIRFFDFKEFEGVETPSRIVFELDGKRFLEIRIKKVNRNKSFSGGTWRLNIPKSYKRVGES